MIGLQGLTQPAIALGCRLAIVREPPSGSPGQADGSGELDVDNRAEVQEVSSPGRTPSGSLFPSRFPKIYISSSIGSAIMMKESGDPCLPKHRSGFAMLIRAGNLLRAEMAGGDNLAMFTAILGRLEITGCTPWDAHACHGV